VLEGGVGEYLRRLPVERLPLSDATRRRLRLLGMVRAGDLLSLPTGALEAQFGKEGQTLLVVIRGEDTREVESWKGVRELEQYRCFDTPVTHGGELLDAARELLGALGRELQSRWQCCRSLSVTLGLENGASRQDVLHFKQPASSSSAMDRRVAACIERLSGDGAVELLCLRVFDLCAGTGTQSSYLDDLPRQARQFKEAVGVLQERYGGDVMKKVVARPGGRLPEERFSFVPCEPEVR
jgi:nucleotidyltransferase/DNA polymerase involved in DNA repair